MPVRGEAFTVDPNAETSLESPDITGGLVSLALGEGGRSTRDAPHWMRIRVLHSFNEWNLAVFAETACLDGPNV